MVTILDNEVVSFGTGRVDGTLAIGVSFIFIAYFLHPAVESAYQRVRAYRAWRAIEMRQAVEVTRYPMLIETFAGRGAWDTARVITVLLAVFSLVSWGLELSMDLAYHKGDADILNRSPPISSTEFRNGSTTQKVMPEEEFDFERNWKSWSNVGNHSATSIYNIINTTTCRTGYVEGSIKVAFWSEIRENAHTRLHYQPDSNHKITVKNLECTADPQPDHISINKGNEPWGNVVECESGPALKANSEVDTPPTLILNKTNDGVYLIVEESSTYPSFLYSVWKSEPKEGEPIELHHVFHIAATMRLAEAVVTAIVHDKASGKYCFELVRMYSESGDQSDGMTRAEPFGEHPTNDSVRIDNLENIQCGLEVDEKAAIFIACLLVLTSVGIAWSLCLRSSIGMDVYDRDEIIRAVTMSGTAATKSPAPSAIRIFVRKEDTGCMSVAISETDDSGRGCAQMFRLGSRVVEDINPSPVAAADTVNQYNQGFGGAAVPVGPRTVWLEGVRTGMGRPYPGRNGNFCYPTSVELIASPVPSNACSLAATPASTSPPLSRVPRGRLARAAGRGASVLFDDVDVSSEGGENERDGMQTGGSNGIEGGGTPSARIAVFGSPGGAPTMLQDVHPPDIEAPRWVDLSVWHGELNSSSGNTTTEAGEESSPVPPFLQRREHTFGPPQLNSLSQDPPE